MKKQYKGAIFDLDGTLINTLSDLADSVNEALEELGYPVWETDAYRLKVGHGFRNLMENSVPQQKREDQDVIDRMLASFVAAYDRRFQNKSCPYEGIETLLHALAGEKLFLAVNSNKRGDYTEKLIRKFFDDIPWVGIYGERAGIPKKPDPAAALELCGKMGLTPDDVVYIGDSNTDIQTGKNAGMDTIGVAWGFRGREELEASGADHIAETAEDIAKILHGEV